MGFVNQFETKLLLIPRFHLAQNIILKFLYESYVLEDDMPKYIIVSFLRVLLFLTCGLIAGRSLVNDFK